MPEHEVDWSALSDQSLAILVAVALPLSEGWEQEGGGGAAGRQLREGGCESQEPAR
jgi:hypothetical protein